VSCEHDRLLALRDFAYGASHELNNPLANIVSRAESLLASETDGERRRKLATIVSQAFRAHEMIADLMLFARPPALSLAPVDVGALLATVVKELSPDAAELSAEISISCPPDLGLTADADQLAAALRAGGRNALEAAGEGGRIEFLARRIESPRSIELRVTRPSRKTVSSIPISAAAKPAAAWAWASARPGGSSPTTAAPSS
jgi:signal transduction histidine kinase